MTRRPLVLILGGTTDAIELATDLSATATNPRLDVMTSYAGSTQSPRQPPGLIRTGGFGGASGLANFLQRESVAAVVDATHPFAARMSWNAHEACAGTRLPLLRLTREPWTAAPGDRWVPVPSLAAAADALVALNARRVFLTTGRQELEPFAALDDVWFLMRSIEPPPVGALPNSEVLLARGPFDVESERGLLQTHHIDAVVTKNSGAAAVAAKLTAARELGLPVVMIDRPPEPPGESVSSIEAASHWVRAQLEPVRVAVQLVDSDADVSADSSSG